MLNQFADTFDLAGLASRVQRAAAKLNLEVEVRQLENPRREMESHYFNPDHQKLFDLGYRPTCDIDGELIGMLSDLHRYRSRILEKQHVLIPDIQWPGNRRKVKYL